MQEKNHRNLAKIVIIFLGILIPSFIFLGPLKGPIYSATSDTVNLQGKIVRNDAGHEGLNVTDGYPACVVSGSGNDTCDFRVRYYDASSGGNLLLTEVFSNVEIGQYLGVFNISLGSDLSPVAGVYSSFSGLIQGEDDVYVEMGFDPAGSNTYTEVFSRMPLQATAYAVRAKYADTATGATEVPWSGLKDPTEDLTIEHTTRKTLFNWATGTG
ncbi:MAG: Hemagglutinin-like protein, partial [candidate division WS6 bacterium 36_33]